MEGSAETHAAPVGVASALSGAANVESETLPTTAAAVPSLSENPVAEQSIPGSNTADEIDEESPSTTDFEIEGRVVLILCGLIASGKSTFAESLQGHFPEFVRCNQDDLGDRRSVENLTRQSLAQGNSACVDRTNFDASQRFHWMKIAREFPGTKVWVIVFDTPYDICAARLQQRTGHPTITSPELGLSVLSRFASDFQSPAAHEGYDRILYLKPSDIPTPEYSRPDIAAILQRVRDSPPVAPAASSHGFPGHPPSHSGWQGRGNSHRASWRGRGAPIRYGNRQDGPPGPVGGYAPAGISTGFRGWNKPSSSARAGEGQGRTSSSGDGDVQINSQTNSTGEGS